eukprot:3689291-Amphidinium_carterae.1
MNYIAITMVKLTTTVPYYNFPIWEDFAEHYNCNCQSCRTANAIISVAKVGSNAFAGFAFVAVVRANGFTWHLEDHT